MEILLGLFVVTQILDFYTTKTILDAGGTEKWPPMRWLGEQIGKTQATVLGKIVGIAAGVTVYLTGPFEAMLALTVLYVGVIIYNQRSMPK